MKNWHLLMTKPREDERAQAHLQNQDYEIFRLLIRRYKIKQGKQVATLEPLFPRYIFIRLDDVLSNWSKIRSTRGVAQLVRFSNHPAIVPDFIVALLTEQCSEEGVLDMTSEEPFVFKKGDCVEITEGSFKGLQAVIAEQKGGDRVLLFLTLLGKEQALEVPISQVKTTR